MSTFAESLKRLYVAGKITLAKVESLLAAGKLDQGEYDYIVG